jgi:hypothetical protein
VKPILFIPIDSKLQTLLKKSYLSFVGSYLRRHQSLHYYGVVVALTDCNVDIFADLLGHYNCCPAEATNEPSDKNIHHRIVEQCELFE